MPAPATSSPHNDAGHSTDHVSSIHGSSHAMEKPALTRSRERTGCWTCRKRKKKCPRDGVPCSTCTRLDLRCETDVRLVWEDDARRIGMKRRGPSAQNTNDAVKTSGGRESTSRSFICSPDHGPAFNDPGTLVSDANRSPSNCLDPEMRVTVPWHSSPANHLSIYPRPLDASDSVLLQNYVERWSRTYPTFSAPSNPFLSVLMPLAMRSQVVLDSILALSGAQRWNDDLNWLEKKSLHLRQQALSGCRSLMESLNQAVALSGPPLSRGGVPRDQEGLLSLLASSILFLLYEKVSGEPSWRPHIEFVNRYFDRWLVLLMNDSAASTEVSEACRFLHSIFVYNDLVRSTALLTRPLSTFYFDVMKLELIKAGRDDANLSPKFKEVAQLRRRFYFPNLIARLSTGDCTVTDADVDAWEGSFDWLPSFALDKPSSDQIAVDGAIAPHESASSDEFIMRELYRTAAKIYRRQILRQRKSDGDPIYREPPETSEPLSQLARTAHTLMRMLPADSIYENALLWPIGIAAKELARSQRVERQNILLRLQSLEKRFHMRHFRKVQHVLATYWAMRDRDGVLCANEALLDTNAILLG